VWEKSKSGSAFTAKYRPVNKHEMISVFGDGVLKYHPQMTAGNPYARTHHARDDAKNNHRIGMNVKSVRTCTDGFRYPITVQRFQQRWRRQDQCHPTQKPVELMEYLIRTYTDEGDLVLDFAAGSGTTGVAALMTGRRCVLVEKEERYCEVAARRIEAASESPADLF
jgi:DNA modification methylase